MSVLSLLPPPTTWFLSALYPLTPPSRCSNLWQTQIYVTRESPDLARKAEKTVWLRHKLSLKRWDGSALRWSMLKTRAGASCWSTYVYWPIYFKCLNSTPNSIRAGSHGEEFSNKKWSPSRSSSGAKKQSRYQWKGGSFSFSFVPLLFSNSTWLLRKWQFLFFIFLWLSRWIPVNWLFNLRSH